MDTYEFTHALIRHTLYGEMSPSRQVRLHRRLAEGLEQVLGAKATESAAEIAYQFHRSAALQGAEKGVTYALAAADRAESGYAWDQVVAQLRVAADLIVEGDPRLPRLLARLGLALPFVSAPGESLPTVLAAAEALAASEGHAAAANYLVEACRVLLDTGSFMEASEAGAAGVRYLGIERDTTWVTLKSLSLLHRDLTAADYPGIPREHPEHTEITEAVREIRRKDPGATIAFGTSFRNRGEAMGSASAAIRMYLGGDLRGALEDLRTMALTAEREGRIDQAGSHWGYVVRTQLALGDLAAADESFRRGVALLRRQPGVANAFAQLMYADRFQRAMVTGEGWREMRAFADGTAGDVRPQFALYYATGLVWRGLAAAACGDAGTAAGAVADVQPAIEHAQVWTTVDYSGIVCDLATTLWWTGNTEHLGTIERNLREKVLAPDFRYPMRDSRLALAYLCVLRGQLAEARHWFAEARRVLDEQGQRPLRAIVDFDEAWALVRAAGLPLTDPAFPPDKHAEVESLLDAAVAQFETIGMPGWIRWAEALRAGRPVIERQGEPSAPGGDTSG